MFYYLQILILLTLSLSICGLVRNSFARFSVSVVFAVLTTMELVALFLTGEPVNYRFYTHLDFNSFDTFGSLFVPQIVLAFVACGLLATILYKSHNWLTRIFPNSYHYYVYPTIALVSLGALALPNGLLSEGFKLYAIVYAEQKSFDQALADVGIAPESYVKPPEVIASPGKNIIVLSLESVEQGFIGSGYDNIMPNLSRLSENWHFFDNMPQHSSGSWTAGSLYNHQVGMPALFSQHHSANNKLFQRTHSVKLTGLGNVLKAAGYQARYLVGNPDFGGMSDILSAYGYRVISEKNSIGQYEDVWFGLHDKDLFHEAQRQISALAKNPNQPFAVFLSTFNTHFPNGFVDRRMIGRAPIRSNRLEFTISSLDYLIGNFISFLKRNQLLKNTAVFIFPDHTLMGTTGPVIEKLRGENRQLYLITNSDEAALPFKTDETV